MTTSAMTTGTVTISAIQIGLPPDVIDFSSPEFARFPGLTPQKLQAAHDGNISLLRQAGFDVDGCQVDLGETAIEVVRDAITARHYDAVLIGAGIRRWFPNPAARHDAAASRAAPAPAPTA
jgi:hypothetical protein